MERAFLTATFSNFISYDQVTIKRNPDFYCVFERLAGSQYGIKSEATIDGKKYEINDYVGVQEQGS